MYLGYTGVIHFWNWQIKDERLWLESKILRIKIVEE